MVRTALVLCSISPGRRGGWTAVAMVCGRRLAASDPRLPPATLSAVPAHPPLAQRGLPRSGDRLRREIVRHRQGCGSREGSSGAERN
jgi:hypothetical protein